tara:strand:+ start:951 stop:1211 length:261 start_codon:yes stop_codon:yes gene_type:complete
MIKEFKYLFFLLIIFFFLIFTLRYYFSDENQKNSYRSINLLDKKIKNLEKNLVLLKNNTQNIIEKVEINKDKKVKKYSFWKLLFND